MISVIIPLMPVPPYDAIYLDAVAALQKQTVDCEIVVSKQNGGGYINKGQLLNLGLSKAKGDIVWFCDADFIPEPTLLEKMENDLIDYCWDVIYPKFYSKTHETLKIADGAPFIWRDILNRYGKFNETHKGISWVTFPLLKWCMDNCVWRCIDKFIIDINPTPQRTAGKRHWKTSEL